ncbi:chitobiase [Chitinispirillum alkaliphilum]|nr:chitobiase [Chitinispirillum alkaliphilum]
MSNSYLHKISLLLLLFYFVSAYSNPTILINQVGYETAGPKTAVVQYSSSFSHSESYLIDENGEVVDTFSIEESESVSGWRGRNFRVIDFSSFDKPGTYRLRAGQTTSPEFRIEEDALLNFTGRDVLGFFKVMRNTFEEDRNIGIIDRPGVTRNLFGGWSDATGDMGKHLSHLSNANYMNPQQTPFVVWSILHSHEIHPDFFGTQAIEEAAWGADYLVRSLSPEGFFYIAVFDNWGWQRETREICSWSGLEGTRSNDYECGMRQGGGVSIAALARAAAAGISGEYDSDTYLQTAIKAYEHLKEFNLDYLDDGRENIIDDYCGLLAASELYNATGEEKYRLDADQRALSLLSRQTEQGWFFSDSARSRPFYHAAEEGFPVVALIRYANLTNPSNIEQIREAVKKNLLWYKYITEKDNNPFGYVKQYRRSEIDDGGNDLARGKQARASSSESRYPAQGAFDGQFDTRWSSVYEQDQQSNNDQWIMVDLGSVYTIDNVVLHWETAFGSKYSIQVSTDDSLWTDVAVIENSSAGRKVHTFSPVEARYVKMQGIERGTEWGYSLYSFQVHEENSGVQASTYFFMPHDNETGYWWQGENARLASMTTAFAMGALFVDSTKNLWYDSLYTLAVNQLNWILGNNPFNVCMMYGFGTINYPNYYGLENYALDNVKGGIANGITASRSDRYDLEWMPYHAENSESLFKDWRWMEQWLPHNAWFLVAVSELTETMRTPFTSVQQTRGLNISPGRSNQIKSVNVKNGVISCSFALPLSTPVELIIYDLKGSKILSEFIADGVSDFRANLNTVFSPGTYILSIKSLNGTSLMSRRFTLFR